MANIILRTSILLIISLMCKFIDGSETTNASSENRFDEDMLLTKLFANYDKRARPVKKGNETVLISMALRVIQLQEVNTREQYISVVGWVRAGWHDPHFSWDPSEYNGLATISVPPTEVWLPTFVLGNSIADSLYNPVWFMYYKVKIKHNGNIVWAPSGQFKADCAIDLTYFPFDEQICEFRFENWIYYSKDVNLTYTDDALTNFDQTSDENLQWKMQEVQVYRNETSYVSANTFAKVYFRLSLKRKPLYYVYTFIIQNVFLSFLILALFKLPAESGEKISMGMTIFLAFAVLLLNVVDEIPYSSQNIPIINIYLLFVLTVSVLAVCETVLVLYMFNHKGTPPPALLVTINDKVLVRILCRTCREKQTSQEKYQQQEPAPNAENQSSQKQPRPAATFINPNFDSDQEQPYHRNRNKGAAPPTAVHMMRFSGGEYHTVSATQESDGIPSEFENSQKWRHISRNIDRISFWFFLIILMLVMLISLVIVPYGYKSKEFSHPTMD